MKKILLVEDDSHVASLINKGLSEEGFEVAIAFTGDMGWDLYQSSQFDLIILDIMMPGFNGLELCQMIRKEDLTIPILFLTALGTSENIVHGLNLGADDYIVKPFKFNEFVARIRTLLRRSDVVSEKKEVPKNILQFADLTVDDDKKMVTRGGQEISLTTTEYRLLMFLLKNKDIVVSRVDILENVWDVTFNLGTNVVDVYVNYLRKKIDLNFEPKLIHTVIGMGYVLKEK